MSVKDFEPLFSALNTEFVGLTSKLDTLINKYEFAIGNPLIGRDIKIHAASRSKRYYYRGFQAIGMPEERQYYLKEQVDRKGMLQKTLKPQEALQTNNADFKIRLG